MNELAYMFGALQVRCEDSVHGPEYCSFLMASKRMVGIQGSVEGVFSVTAALLRWSASTGDSRIERRIAIGFGAFHIRPFSSLQYYTTELTSYVEKTAPRRRLSFVILK